MVATRRATPSKPADKKNPSPNVNDAGPGSRRKGATPAKGASKTDELTSVRNTRSTRSSATLTESKGGSARGRTAGTAKTIPLTPKKVLSSPKKGAGMNKSPVQEKRATTEKKTPQTPSSPATEVDDAAGGRGKRQRIPSKKFQDMETDFAPKKRKTDSPIKSKPAKQSTTVVASAVEDIVAEQNVEKEDEDTEQTQQKEVVSEEPMETDSMDNQMKAATANEAPTGGEVSTAAEPKSSQTSMVAKELTTTKGEQAADPSATSVGAEKLVEAGAIVEHTSDGSPIKPGKIMAVKKTITCKVSERNPPHSASPVTTLMVGMPKVSVPVVSVEAPGHDAAASAGQQLVTSEPTMLDMASNSNEQQPAPSVVPTEAEISTISAQDGSETDMTNQSDELNQHGVMETQPPADVPAGQSVARDATEEPEEEYAEAAVYTLRPDGTLVKTAIPPHIRAKISQLQTSVRTGASPVVEVKQAVPVEFPFADTNHQFVAETGSHPDPTVLVERPVTSTDPDPTQLVQQPALMMDHLAESLSPSDLDTVNSMLQTMEGEDPMDGSQMIQREEEIPTSSGNLQITDASGRTIMLNPDINGQTIPHNAGKGDMVMMSGEQQAQVITLGEGSASDQRDVIVEVYIDRSDPNNPTVKRAYNVGGRDTVSISDPERTIYDGKEIFNCSQCKYVTERRANFFKHKKSHMGERPFPCQQCPYSARTSTNLRRHMLTHTDERKFQCPKCDLRFKQKIHMDKHINYIHGEKNIKCQYCDYMCANATPDLKLHLKRKHLKMNPEDPPTYLECDKCGFLAGSKKDLKQHSKFHRAGPELKLFCETCSFVTDAKSRLERHKRTHTQDKPFACAHCDYRATQREHINRHMRSRHNIESVKEAKPAEIATGTGEPVEENVVDVDSDNHVSGQEIPTVTQQKPKSKPSTKYEPPNYSDKEKVFGCSHCTMKFVRLLSLYKHLHSQHADLLPDTEEEKLTCVVCDYKAVNHKTLLVHMRRHNNLETDETEIPGQEYGCVLCKYTNGKRRNLYQHLKKKHKISIMVKRDGTASCVVEHNAAVTVVASGEGQEVTEIVSVAGEGNTSEPNRVVNILDLANSLTQKHEVEQPTVAVSSSHSGLIVDESLVDSSNVHAAAEAIVDLASQNVIRTMPMMESTSVETEQRVEVSNVQLNSLSSGDLIEINGEKYKVEFTDNVITATKQDKPTSAETDQLAQADAVAEAVAQAASTAQTIEEEVVITQATDEHVITAQVDSNEIVITQVSDS